MDNLQELLDERWPLTNDDFMKKSELRQAFTEGYNAAIQEMRGNVIKQTGKELTEREILERATTQNGIIPIFTL